MNRPVRAGALVCAAVLFAGLVWGCGFVAFNHAVRRHGPIPDSADGIVVLTGGAERIEMGLLLLAEGRAPRMLVSGVGRGLDLTELVHRVPLSAEQMESVTQHVTLGRMATTTVGNATETAGWARTYGVRSLIVVTAGYHMPRALIEIGRALPGVALYPMPVQSPVLRRGMEFATVRLIANEYDKYLVVRLGLTRSLTRGLTQSLFWGPVRHTEVSGS